jgi:hypothetical protein
MVGTFDQGLAALAGFDVVLEEVKARRAEAAKAKAEMEAAALAATHDAKHEGWCVWAIRVTIFFHTPGS